VLSGLGAARGPAEESTVRRAFALVSADVLDQILGAWLHTRVVQADGRLVIAVDGKAVRGATLYRQLKKLPWARVVGRQAPEGPLAVTGPPAPP
jgi:hypothetical protein